MLFKLCSATLKPNNVSVISYGAYAYDVMPAVLVFQHNEMAAMLVNQTSSSSSSSIFIYIRNRIILHGLPRNRV